jgi:hypothetical protein
MTRAERGLWFPTHVVRCAAAIHPIDEDLSMGTPKNGAPIFVLIDVSLKCGSFDSAYPIDFVDGAPKTLRSG